MSPYSTASIAARCPEWRRAFSAPPPRTCAGTASSKIDPIRIRDAAEEHDRPTTVMASLTLPSTRRDTCEESRDVDDRHVGESRREIPLETRPRGRLGRPFHGRDECRGRPPRAPGPENEHEAAGARVAQSTERTLVTVASDRPAENVKPDHVAGLQPLPLGEALLDRTPAPRPARRRPEFPRDDPLVLRQGRAVRSRQLAAKAAAAAAELLVAVEGRSRRPLTAVNARAAAPESSRGVPGRALHAKERADAVRPGRVALDQKHVRHSGRYVDAMARRGCPRARARRRQEGRVPRRAGPARTWCRPSHPPRACLTANAAPLQGRMAGRQGAGRQQQQRHSGKPPARIAPARHDPAATRQPPRAGRRCEVVPNQTASRRAANRFRRRARVSMGHVADLEQRHEANNQRHEQADAGPWTQRGRQTRRRVECRSPGRTTGPQPGNRPGRAEDARIAAGPRAIAAILHDLDGQDLPRHAADRTEDRDAAQLSDCTNTRDAPDAHAAGDHDDETDEVR